MKKKKNYPTDSKLNINLLIRQPQTKNKKPYSKKNLKKLNNQ